jgi:hypothetical protein
MEVSYSLPLSLNHRTVAGQKQMYLQVRQTIYGFFEEGAIATR